MKELSRVDISPRRTGESLVFGGEINAGRLTYWGEKVNVESSEEFRSSLLRLVKGNSSINLYVAHGGSNFRLTAGASGSTDYNYQSMTTSYGYDAPIDEQGAPTYKYHSIREIMKNYTKNIVTSIPISIKRISIPPVNVANVEGYLLGNLPKPKLVDSELTYFESNQLKMYQQGFVLYETTLKEKKDYLFNVTFGDFMMVYVDGKFQGSLAREKKASQQLKVSCPVGGCNLRLLVEAMGHINYGAKQKTDRKGLHEFTELDSESKTEFRWDITALPITASLFFWKPTVIQATFPVMKSATFELEETGDTFFDVSSFGKGYLWVNGNLLGRYWSKGPQQRMFCPGVWLSHG